MAANVEIVPRDESIANAACRSVQTKISEITLIVAVPTYTHQRLELQPLTSASQPNLLNIEGLRL